MKITVKAKPEMLPLEYSLHDAVVTAIECEENRITMHFEDGFACVGENDGRAAGEPYENVKGSIEFDGVDYDFCTCILLNCTLNEGKFKGEKMSLESFVKKHDKMRFEIISESYGYNRATLSGWFWTKKKPYFHSEHSKSQSTSHSLRRSAEGFLNSVLMRNKAMPNECILELYFSGDMRYLTEE